MRWNPALRIPETVGINNIMKKTTLLLIFALFVLFINAQSEKAFTSIFLSYQNNSWLTHIPDGDTIFSGANYQINNMTYLLNNERFSLGFGVGLLLSTNKYDNSYIRETRIPISLFQQIDLKNLEPIVSYIRYAISKEFVLSSQKSVNNGEDFNSITDLNNNPISAELLLGWKIKEQMVFEVGYSYRQLSYNINHYAKHNLNVGIGFFLK